MDILSNLEIGVLKETDEMEYRNNNSIYIKKIVKAYG